MSSCINFEGYKCKQGYGKKWRHGKMCLAHRLAWIDTHGHILNGMCVLHRCDNPSCINTEHLFLGTNADNVRDKCAKGRQARNFKSPAQREKLCKLTKEDVFDIRRRIIEGKSQRAIAKIYGVNQATISEINTRITWSHV